MLHQRIAPLCVVVMMSGACGSSRAPVPRDAVPRVARESTAPRSTATPVPDAGASSVADALQLVVVSVAGWDTTGGTLQRYERLRTGDRWQVAGREVPVVVGRTGLAWDDRFEPAGRGPVKREGDGRAPAGVFSLDGAFGFASAADTRWVRLLYLPVGEGTECVDDVSSVHYNTVVERETVPRIDWTSSEKMRRIDQYRLGVLVGYNSPPVGAGRGSCIFLHVWAGPGTSTAGCTAMSEGALRDVMLWLRPDRRPALVQLPAMELRRLRGEWGLP